jgi:hypothetical protein
LDTELVFSYLDLSQLKIQLHPFAPVIKPLGLFLLSVVIIVTSWRLFPSANSRHNTEESFRSETAIGRDCFLRKDFAEARKHLIKAAKQSPDSSAVQLLLGASDRELGNLEESVKDFRRAIANDPTNILAMKELALTYVFLSDNDSAVKIYSQVLNNLPADSSTDREQLVKIIDCLRSGNASSEDYCAAIKEHPWRSKAFPLRVFVKPNQTFPQFSSHYKSLLDESFSKWCKASNNKLSYVFVDSSDDADVVCSYSDDIGRSAVSETVGRTGPVLEGPHTAKVYMDVRANERMWYSPEGPTSIARSCLHEVGHCLGIDGHSSNVHDVMFIATDHLSGSPELSSRDISTIRRMYSAGRP